jgi:hypothetical protein
MELRKWLKGFSKVFYFGDKLRFFDRASWCSGKLCSGNNLTLLPTGSSVGIQEGSDHFHSYPLKFTVFYHPITPSSGGKVKRKWS